MAYNAASQDGVLKQGPNTLPQGKRSLSILAGDNRWKLSVLEAQIVSQSLIMRLHPDQSHTCLLLMEVDILMPKDVGR
jgi:hypothetical protein